MYNLGVSLACILVTLVICRISRVLVGFLVQNNLHKVLVLETISTFELCACVFEIGVIMENYGFMAYAILMLFMFNYYRRTWSPATTTPCSHVLDIYLGKTDVKSGFMKIGAQILAGCVVYQMYTKNVWGLGYQEKHLERLVNAGRCRTHLQVPLLQGMLIEAACVFALQTSAKLFGPLKYSILYLPLSVVTVKYSGMKLTGAWSNPILASTIQFGCSGISALEHLLVYWIGPIIGTLVNYYVFSFIQRSLQPETKKAKSPKRESKKNKKAKQGKGAKAD